MVDANGLKCNIHILASMNQTMTSPLPFLATLFLIAICGCSSITSADTIRTVGELKVLSEFREYYRDGGRTQYREISLKHKGWAVDPDLIGKKLFPPGSPCNTPFYRISDIRILKDNTLLALFIETQQRCGLAQMAKIETKGGKMNVLRIPLGEHDPAMKDVRYPGAATSMHFGRVVNQRIVFGYSNTTDELETQQRSAEQWVFLNSLTGAEADNNTIAYEFEHAFAVDMSDGKARDLGFGHIEGVLGDGQIALIRHAIRSEPTRAFVEYRAVRIADGTQIDSQRLPLHCFEPSGKRAIESENSNIRMSEQDDRNQANLEATIEADRRALGMPPLNTATADERAELAQQQKIEIKLRARNDAVSRYLEAKHIEVEWKNDRVNIKVGDQLLEKRNCVARPA